MTDLDRLADAMLPTALDLVCHVKDLSEEVCHEILAPLDRQQLTALAVVLAALVPDDQSVDDLLAWMRVEPESADGPISIRRAMANRAKLEQELAAVDRYKRPSAGRLEDYRELRSQGMSVVDAAERVGVTNRTAERYEQRLREASEAAS